MKYHNFASIPVNLHTEELIHYATLGMIDLGQCADRLQKMFQHIEDDDYTRGHRIGYIEGYDAALDSED